ncbi:uncharacterized protein PgNI_07012 [Pyricularia grisea]|uniref:Uncharacterized protein n=1 Tax=Pyricularia grisea TaxID=148305 RepID=A0A6P8B0X6_PYRGI|nr:uncharacterized protein PgNI_07012 [Pyricularia grisea]TLD08489.1 hypothetical protein PgNI_07012 [Pyricularia grisea]
MARRMSILWVCQWPNRYIPTYQRDSHLMIPLELKEAVITARKDTGYNASRIHDSCKGCVCFGISGIFSTDWYE